MPPAVSLLLPANQPAGPLERTLARIAGTSHEHSVEVLIRCDSGDGAVIDYLRTQPCRLIVGPPVAGPARYAELAALVNGEVVVYGRPNIEFTDPDWLPRLLGASRRFGDGLFHFSLAADGNRPVSAVSRSLLRSLEQLDDPRVTCAHAFLHDVAERFGRALHLPLVAPDRSEAAPAPAPADRSLHDAAVADAVARIERARRSMTEAVIRFVEAYDPPAAQLDDRWPPSQSLHQWGASIPGSIPCTRADIARVLDVVFRHGLNVGQVCTTSLGHGLFCLLWSRVFDEVVVLDRGGGAGDAFRSGALTMLPGDFGQPQFEASLDHFGNLRALVIETDYYAHAMATYFRVGSRLRTPGIIVFVTRVQRDGGSGMRRLIEDLRSGRVDGGQHAIVDVAGPAADRIVSYELRGPGQSDTAIAGGAVPDREDEARAADAQPMLPDRQVHLIAEGVNGFNIVRHDGLWIAVAQGDGAFTRRRLLERDFRDGFVAASEDELRQALAEGPGSPCHISRAELPPGAVPPTRALPVVQAAPPVVKTPVDLSIRLVEEGVEGFNILQHAGLWIGVGQSDGMFTRERLLTRDFVHAFVAHTEAELRSALGQGRRSAYHVSRAPLPPGADPPISMLPVGPAGPALAESEAQTSHGGPLRSRFANDLAWAFRRDGQLKTALIWFNRALKDDSTNRTARLGRARVLFECGQIVPAKADLTALLKVTPKADSSRCEIFAARGWAHFQLRRWSDASHDFTKALQLTATTTAGMMVARRGRAWAAWREGRRRAALRDFLRLERLAGATSARPGLRFRWFVCVGWLLTMTWPLTARALLRPLRAYFHAGVNPNRQGDRGAAAPVGRRPDTTGAFSDAVNAGPE